MLPLLIALPQCFPNFKQTYSNPQSMKLPIENETTVDDGKITFPHQCLPDKVSAISEH